MTEPVPRFPREHDPARRCLSYGAPGMRCTKPHRHQGLHGNGPVCWDHGTCPRCGIAMPDSEGAAYIGHVCDPSNIDRDPELDGARLEVLCAMLREVAVRGLEQAKAEAHEAEKELYAAHERLESALATLVEWTQYSERAVRLTAEAEARR